MALDSNNTPSASGPEHLPVERGSALEKAIFTFLNSLSDNQAAKDIFSDKLDQIERKMQIIETHQDELFSGVSDTNINLNYNLRLSEIGEIIDAMVLELQVLGISEENNGCLNQYLIFMNIFLEAKGALYTAMQTQTNKKKSH